MKVHFPLVKELPAVRGWFLGRIIEMEIEKGKKMGFVAKSPGESPSFAPHPLSPKTTM